MLDITFGVPIAVALIAAVVSGRRGAAGARAAIFWGAAATLVVIWFAASQCLTPARVPPATIRYLSANAAILLVCLCAAIPRPRLSDAEVWSSHCRALAS